MKQVEIPHPQVNMSDSYVRTILVTGSNTGIGYALVRQLAQKGHVVYLASRNEASGKEAQSALHSIFSLSPSDRIDLQSKAQV